MRNVDIDNVDVVGKDSLLVEDLGQVDISSLLLVFFLAITVVHYQLVNKSLYQEEGEESQKHVDLLHAGLDQLALFNLGAVLQLLV